MCAVIRPLFTSDVVSARLDPIRYCYVFFQLSPTRYMINTACFHGCDTIAPFGIKQIVPAPRPLIVPCDCCRSGACHYANQRHDVLFMSCFGRQELSSSPPLSSKQYTTGSVIGIQKVFVTDVPLRYNEAIYYFQRSKSM